MYARKGIEKLIALFCGCRDYKNSACSLSLYFPIVSNVYINDYFGDHIKSKVFSF